MPRIKLSAMTFAKVYPLYVQKAQRKNRTKEEVDRIICWLTGYDRAGLRRQIEQEVDLETFYAQAPRIHPNSALIKGVVCGCARGRHRRSIDAKRSLLRQAHRRVGKGKSAGEDSAAMTRFDTSERRRANQTLDWTGASTDLLIRKLVVGPGQ